MQTQNDGGIGETLRGKHDPVERRPTSLGSVPLLPHHFIPWSVPRATIPSFCPRFRAKGKDNIAGPLILVSGAWGIRTAPHSPVRAIAQIQ